MLNFQSSTRPGADEVREEAVVYCYFLFVGGKNGSIEGALGAECVGGDVEGYLELGHAGVVEEFVECLLGGPVDEVIQHSFLLLVGVDILGLGRGGKAVGDALYAVRDVLDVESDGAFGAIGHGGVAAGVGDADIR